MARISLLFSLALVLAIVSVSAHPKKTQKSLCPSTLSGLQSFSTVEISKLIEKKAQFAPKSNQFNALFSVLKGYNDYLVAIKFGAAKDVSGSVYTKYGLMTRAMLAAQSAIGVEGALSVKLRKSYAAMAGRFVELIKNIGEVSKKYKFDANAEISKVDRAKIEKCLIKLKGSINVFVKVISACSKNISAGKDIPFSVSPGSGFVGDFAKNGLSFGGDSAKLSGHGLAQGEAKFGAHGEGKIGAHAVGKLGAFVGGKARANAKGKIGGKAGGNVGAQADAKAKAGAKAGGMFGGLLGFGGKVQYDAAGKAGFGGGNGFKSLPRKKHLN